MLLLFLYAACSLSVVAFAAETAKLADFSAFDGEATASASAGWWGPDAANDHTMTFADGKVTFADDAAGRWSAFPSFDADAQAATMNATGIAFYVEGDADADQTIALSFNGVDTKNYIMSVDADVKLVEADGNVIDDVTVATPFGGQGGVIIPAGFEGYVYVPFAAYILNGGSDAFDAAGGVATPIYALGTDVVNLTIGEFLAYTGEVTGAPAGDDEQESTADISVIAYAAAAITGLGALVVAKKR